MSTQNETPWLSRDSRNPLLAWSPPRAWLLRHTRGSWNGTLSTSSCPPMFLMSHTTRITIAHAYHDHRNLLTIHRAWQQPRVTMPKRFLVDDFDHPIACTNVNQTLGQQSFCRAARQAQSRKPMSGSIFRWARKLYFERTIQHKGHEAWGTKTMTSLTRCVETPGNAFTTPPFSFLISHSLTMSSIALVARR